MAVTMHHISTGAISRYFWIAHIAVFLLHCARASQDGTDSQVNSPRRFNVVRAMFVSCITVTTVFATICSQHYSTKIATKYKSLTQRSTNVSIGMQTRQATLATYPRSGTSWVREMLRTASGVSTKMTTTKDELAWVLFLFLETPLEGLKATECEILNTKSVLKNISAMIRICHFIAFVPVFLCLVTDTLTRDLLGQLKLCLT